MSSSVPAAEHTSRSAGAPRTKRRVLVVDDEENVVHLVASALRFDGFETVTADNGHSALAAVAEHDPDLVVLDVMMPGLDGHAVLQHLRSAGSIVPVIFLTARDTANDRVAGLRSGADDYVVKPFSVEELLARVHAVLRRTQAEVDRDGVLRVADLELDENSHEVTRAGEEVHLTATEFELLRYLMRNERVVLSKAQILDRVWKYDFQGQSNIVELYIGYLRKKIDHVEPEADPHRPRRRLRGQGAAGVTQPPARDSTGRTADHRTPAAPTSALPPPTAAAPRGHRPPACRRGWLPRTLTARLVIGVVGAAAGAWSPSPAPPPTSAAVVPAAAGWTSSSTSVAVGNADQRPRSASCPAAACRSAPPSDGRTASSWRPPQRSRPDRLRLPAATPSVNRHAPTARSLSSWTCPTTGAPVDRPPEQGPHASATDGEPAARAGRSIQIQRRQRSVVIGLSTRGGRPHPAAAAAAGARLIGAARGAAGRRPDQLGRPGRAAAAAPGHPDRAGGHRRARPGRLRPGPAGARTPTPTTEVGQVASSVNTLLQAVETEFAARVRSEERMRQFLADASHELRTPLTSIRGYAELSRLQARRPADAAGRLDAPDRGRGHPDVPAGRGPAGAGPRRPGHRAAPRAGRGRRAARRGRRARCRRPIPNASSTVARSGGAVVIGDRDQLLRVLINLATNAADPHPPAGPIRLEAMRGRTPRRRRRSRCGSSTPAPACRRRRPRTSSNGSGGRTRPAAGPRAAAGWAWRSSPRSSHAHGGTVAVRLLGRARHHGHGHPAGAAGRPGRPPAAPAAGPAGLRAWPATAESSAWPPRRPPPTSTRRSPPGSSATRPAWSPRSSSSTTPARC